MQLNQKIGQVTGLQKYTMRAQYSHQKSINKPAMAAKPTMDSSFKPTTGKKEILCGISLLNYPKEI